MDYQAALKDVNEKVNIARHLEQTHKEYQKAVINLQLVNKYVKSGQVWKPKLCIEKGNNYNNGTEIEVRVSSGIIQQQAIDQVRRWKRALINLGVNI